jgi:hypothetical protein
VIQQQTPGIAVITTTGFPIAAARGCTRGAIYRALRPSKFLSHALNRSVSQTLRLLFFGAQSVAHLFGANRHEPYVCVGPLSIKYPLDIASRHEV